MPSHRFTVTVLLACLSAAPLAAQKSAAPIPEKPTTPATRWEYKILTREEVVGLGNKDLAAGLNKLGDEGWELISVPQRLAGGPAQAGYGSDFFFKRSKARATGEEVKPPPLKVETKNEDYEILKLKNISAVDFVKTADALFGGKTNGGPHLVAEPITNSLLVQGTPRQIDDLRRLIVALDVVDAAVGAAEVVARTEVLRLKYAKVTDVAQVLQAVYGKDKSFRIGVDERTNSLIFNGADKQLAAMEALVNKLDIEADKDVPTPKKP